LKKGGKRERASEGGCSSTLYDTEGEEEGSLSRGGCREGWFPSLSSGAQYVSRGTGTEKREGNTRRTYFLKSRRKSCSPYLGENEGRKDWGEGEGRHGTGICSSGARGAL